MSPKSAGLAKKMGYADIKVYVEGEPGWKKAGHYTLSSPEYVATTTKINTAVLIDLRSPEAAAKGHIPNAVNIPLAKLESADDKFPAYRGASIIFYSDKESDIVAAIKTAHEWGYKNATALQGGLDMWKAKGYELKTGPVSSEIRYSRKLEPGEISIAEFVEALNSGKAVVLDVRNPDEFAKGHFKGAINIPAEDIATRLSELPKDKTILVHCSTGVRAEMAYALLKEKGYNIKFLKADVEFEPNGKYQISG